jgi:inner membrane protein
MPSTLVHLSIAALIAAVLLGEAFGRRSLAVVLAVTAIPDLDSFIALYAPFGHRSVLHNFTIPVLFGLAIWIDLRVREDSFLRSRWGVWGVRVAWVSVVCYAFAHVAVDMTDGIVNLLWPIHDQFYSLRGEIELSSQRGIVQTFTEPGEGVFLLEPAGNTGERELTTGVDPGDGATERIFPVFGSGLELLVTLIGVGVTAARLRLPWELGE